MSIRPLHLSESWLGALVRPGRDVCRHMATAWPGSPACARLRCASIRSTDRIERGGVVARVAFERLEGGGAVRVSDALALELLTCVLGGEPDDDEGVLDRPLSAVERALAPFALDVVLGCWGRALDDAVALDPGDAAEREARSWIAWDLEAGEGLALQLFLDSTAAQAAARDDGALPPGALAVHDFTVAETALEVGIGRVAANLGDLARLAPGAIVDLAVALEEPWILRCGGTFLGQVRPALVHGAPSLVLTERSLS
jgi:hypothetical protein